MVTLVAMVAAPGCHLYHPRPVAGAQPERTDSLRAGELSPRDLTGSVTAWDVTFGADSLYRPRITSYSQNGIGVRLLRPAHVAVLLATRCGPYAIVPGVDLTERVSAGEHWFPMRPYRGACAPNFWRPLVTVIAAALPMHGEVLEDTARRAHSVEELMAGRRDAWAVYAVYASELP